MALIVQKYGGTSVGSAERIRDVARRVAKTKAQGHDVVVVVSAMSGETNRLIALAKEIHDPPDPRELDVPPVGLIEVVDPATGRRREVRVTRSVQRKYAAAATAHAVTHG